MLYAKHLVDDVLAYQELKPPKARPNVECYSGPLGMPPSDFSDYLLASNSMQVVREHGHCMAVDPIVTLLL